MPRTSADNAAVRAATRARILEHALDLFADQGYAGVSVRSLARAAGMAQGLLYAYFDGKLGVLRALFEASLEAVGESFAAMERVPAPDRLAALIRASLAIIRRDQRLFRVSYGLRSQRSVLDALGPRVHVWTRALTRALERELRRARVPQPTLEARLLFATIDGVCQHYCLDPRRYPLDQVTEALVRRYAPRPRRKP